MTVLNASDPTLSIPLLFELLRRGEPVVFIENGRPLGHALPADPVPDSADEDDVDPWWRGTYEVKVPVKRLETEGQPVFVGRRLPEINTAWYRSHDDDE
jgi:hypothetical protein